MSILINKQTNVLVQGITGKEGQKATRAMLSYGTNVVCGVTPGKGGQTVEDRPVFNTIKEALQKFPEVNTSAIYVPPFAAKDGILEAITNGIKTINVMTERVPIIDTAICLKTAKENEVRIIGPSSLGYIVPNVGRVGVVGGPLELANEIFQAGSIGVISRSGGMTNELSWQVRQAGLGQSAAIHIGGDLLIGTNYRDLLELFEQDKKTKAVIIFGEHGGSYEFAIVDLLKTGGFTKPLAIYVGGKFANLFPEGTTIGHAGAIVEKGRGAAEKETALKNAGAMVAEHYEELVTLIKPYA